MVGMPPPFSSHSITLPWHFHPKDKRSGKSHLRPSSPNKSSSSKDLRQSRTKVYFNLGGHVFLPLKNFRVKNKSRRVPTTAIIKQSRSNSLIPSPPNGMSEFKIALFGSGGIFPPFQGLLESFFGAGES
jgi:hypothetical protein